MSEVQDRGYALVVSALGRLLPIQASIWNSLKAICGILLLAQAVGTAVFAQSSPEVVPLDVTWTAPVKNQDGSCLSGAESNCSNDLAGFKIYRSSSSSTSNAPTPLFYSYQQANSNRFIDSQIVPGLVYHYTITAIDTSGNESTFSPIIKIRALTPAADEDKDGILNGMDNCPFNANPDQRDSNTDGRGDACPAPVPPTNDEKAPEEDNDTDGTSNSADNCPEVYNPDQSDINLNGIGDVCDAPGLRTACLRDLSSALSSIALINSDKLYLFQASKSSTVFTQAPGPQTAMLGNFDNSSVDNSQFGELEVAAVSTSQDGRLSWNLNLNSSQNTLDTIAFGENGDRTLGCFADFDPVLDIAVANNKHFKIRRSSDQKEVLVDFSTLGLAPEAIRNVSCSDTDGDGIDELLVLHKPVAAESQLNGLQGNPKKSLSVSAYRISTQALLTRVQVDRRTRKIATAITKVNGKPEICAGYNSNASNSTISCNGTKKKRLIIPLFKDFVAGRFESASKPEGFVVLSKDNKLYLVKSSGRVQNLTTPSAGLRNRAGSSKTIKLLPCR